MSDFTWIGGAENLSPVALTIRAQSINPQDVPGIRYDTFFPHVNVDGIKLSELTALDLRPAAADRREWDARGRLIPLETPALREIEMVPIEAYFKVGEREINVLNSRFSGNMALFVQQIGATIPTRTDTLVRSNYARLEFDAMEAWTTGIITAMNPATGTTQAVDLGIDANRITTATTPWDDAGVNAYDLLLAWLEASSGFLNSYRGVALSQKLLAVIQADAPTGTAGFTLGVLDLEERVRNDTGTAFRFFRMDHRLYKFDDGGTAKTLTRVWPENHMALIPSDNRVGSTFRAPVSRAYEISRMASEAPIDLNGMMVYHEIENGGRGLTVECQGNYLPFPDEQQVYVIDTDLA